MIDISAGGYQNGRFGRDPSHQSTDAGVHSKIVALTAHAMEEERREILAAGCDDFVRKPFREHEIFGVMGKHLGLRYVYEGSREKAVPVAPEVEIRPERLAALPADLLSRLHQAVVELDEDQTLALIEKIKTIDERTAKGIDALARNLAYDTLLELLERSEEPMHGDIHD